MISLKTRSEGDGGGGRESPLVTSFPFMQTKLNFGQSLILQEDTTCKFSEILKQKWMCI